MSRSRNGSPSAETFTGLLCADRGAGPMSKTYFYGARGELCSTSAPKTYLCSSFAQDYTCTAEFASILRGVADAGGCMLTGRLSRPLDKESRAGTTKSDTTTRLLTLDFDGLLGVDLETILMLLGLAGISHVVQWSASAGLKPGLRCHVFLMLTRRVRPSAIKNWLKHLNLTVPALRAGIKLHKNGIGLHWPLDITVNDSGRLTYIAPPTLIDVPDPFEGKPRITHHVGERDRLTFRKAPPVAEEQVAEVRDALRAGQGLPPYAPRKSATVRCVTVYRDPEPGEVYGEPYYTGHDNPASRMCRFGLCADDRDCYYYNVLTPRYVYSFAMAGEPPFLLRELVPDHYNDVAVPLANQMRRDLCMPAFMEDC